MIYLDNAATAPIFNDVQKLINEVNGKDFFNPSALYLPSVKLKNKIDQTRKIIAKKIGAEAQEIYFTSGATESNNWAITKGFKNKKGNVVATGGEHSSLYESCMALKNQGLDVRFSPLNNDGSVSEEKFMKLIDSNTALVSVIHCSNETGAVNDIFRLSKMVKDINDKIIFHSDGVQAFAKYNYNIGFSDVDLYSFSGHKIGAPKGIGGLYISKNINIQPFILGGGQEGNMRSGTENVSGILGLGKAVECFEQEYKKDKIISMCELIKNKIYNGLSNIKFVTENFDCGIISLNVKGIKAEVLQRILAQNEIYIGLGSACAAKLSYNRVLSEIGLSKKEIEGSVRISISCHNNAEEIKFAAEKLIETVNLLRG